MVNRILRSLLDEPFRGNHGIDVNQRVEEGEDQQIIQSEEVKSCECDENLNLFAGSK